MLQGERRVSSAGGALEGRHRILQARHFGHPIPAVASTQGGEENKHQKFRLHRGFGDRGSRAVQGEPVRVQGLLRVS